MLKFDLQRGSLLCFLGRFISSNVYLMVAEDEAVAIDCGMPWTAKRVVNYLNKSGVSLEYVLLTHSHFDHVMGMKRLTEHTETRVVAHSRSKRGDLKAEDGDVIKALDEQLRFSVMYTGIHKADHVWYFERNNRVLFVGDHLPTPVMMKTLSKRHGTEPKIISPGHGRPTIF